MTGEYYVKIDAVEEDGKEYNHLFHMVYHGKEYFIAWSGDSKIGQEGEKVWLSWSKLECDTVHTVESINGNLVSGTVRLCSAHDVKRGAQ